MEDIKFWALITCLLLIPTSVLALRIAIKSLKNHGTRLYAWGETEEQLRHRNTLATIADNTSKVIIRQLEIENSIFALEKEIKSLKTELNKITVELKRNEHD